MASVRPAETADIGAVYEMIRELAAYEKLEDMISGTEEDLRRSLFEERSANALIAESDGKPVGYCIYFYNFSTFKCRKGLFIEDIYVKPEYRGEGLGRCMLLYLADKAKRENCGRMEWNCLEWNPTEEFYKKMGAERINDWDIFRVDESGFDTFGGRHGGEKQPWTRCGP